MKPLLYIGLLSAFSWATAQRAFAQKTALANPPFGKGSWQLDLKGGYGASPLLGNRNTVQLEAGYYVVNRLLVGLVGSIHGSWLRLLVTGIYSRQAL